MVLRSASTSSLGSFLPSHIESNFRASSKPSTLSSPRKCPPKRLSFQGKLSPMTSPRTINTSPSFRTEFTPSAPTDSIPNTRLRRVQSTGTLDGLLATTSKNLDEFTSLTATKKYPCIPHFPLLQPILLFNEHGLCDEDVQDGEEGEKIIQAKRYTLENRKKENEYSNLDMESSTKSKRLGNVAKMENTGTRVPSKMHIARGLGATIPGGNNGGGNEGHYKRRGFDDSSGTSVKEYYMRMMKENPGNPLFLSNYAQFLHQINELQGAEEYYARAIQADSSNSQILSGYAQVIWELHRDEERASNYFQRAQETAPKDSHMLAAYASFLWDTHQTDNRAISTS